jgi:hypothetical protein
MDVYKISGIKNKTTTSHKRCMGKTKSSIVMAKAAFSRKKSFVRTSKLDLNLRKKLVKCYILSIALYGAETWTLEKED